LEHSFAFIETQLWVVIVLLAAFVVGNILCNLLNCKARGPRPFSPNLRDLWERNQLDKLLVEAARYRSKFPNNADAHYFAIKALIAKKRYAEAHDLASHLAQIEPKLNDVIQSWLALIDRMQAS
jgi:hypothetical protein